MMKDTALIVVDMIYDFIDGSLACFHAEEAVQASLAFIDKVTADTETDPTGVHDTFPILFVCDHHPADHCSFAAQGGPWPPHCVAGTRGGQIHEALAPHALEELTFFKGEDPAREQYSGYESKNMAGQSLSEVLALMDIKTVYVSGIATEYCVKNTAEDLLKAGFKVNVLTDCLGYVDHQGHLDTLPVLESEGIRLL